MGSPGRPAPDGWVIRRLTDTVTIEVPAVDAAGKPLLDPPGNEPLTYELALVDWNGEPVPPDLASVFMDSLIAGRNAVKEGQPA